MSDEHMRRLEMWMQVLAIGLMFALAAMIFQLTAAEILGYWR